MTSSTLTIVRPIVGVHVFFHLLLHFLFDDHFSCGRDSKHLLGAPAGGWLRPAPPPMRLQHVGPTAASSRLPLSTSPSLGGLSIRGRRPRPSGGSWPHLPPPALRPRPWQGLTFSNFLNNFFRKDKVPFWIREWKNLRLVLMVNREFYFFLRSKTDRVILVNDKRVRANSGAPSEPPRGLPRWARRGENGSPPVSPWGQSTDPGRVRPRRRPGRDTGLAAHALRGRLAAAVMSSEESDRPGAEDSGRGDWQVREADGPACLALTAAMLFTLT